MCLRTKEHVPPFPVVRSHSARITKRYINYIYIRFLLRALRCSPAILTCINENNGLNAMQTSSCRIKKKAFKSRFIICVRCSRIIVEKKDIRSHLLNQERGRGGTRPLLSSPSERTARSSNHLGAAAGQETGGKRGGWVLGSCVLDYYIPSQLLGSSLAESGFPAARRDSLFLSLSLSLCLSALHLFSTDVCTLDRYHVYPKPKTFPLPTRLTTTDNLNDAIFR